MAEYTIELRKIVEGGRNIFPFSYPFYDEKKRPDFEKRFIKHFYFREIGCDTVDRFIHYLDDKMNTVFPYYNKLFKTAAIEYSVLDNYNIKETTTMKRENVGASSGESYSVGKILNEQSTETNELRNAQKVANGNAETIKSATDDLISHSEGSEKVVEELDVKEDNTGSVTKTIDVTETIDSDTSKKFLDTPQGQVDLKDSKYLTSLGLDETDATNTKKGTDKDVNDLHKNIDSDKITTSETEKDVTENRTLSGNETTTNKDNVSEDETANTTNKFSGEERTTADNNTRTHSEGSTTETIEHTRKGNIGVDTDADMIQKHIKLQKILSQIEKMFFDECEDLFMLVW